MKENSLLSSMVVQNGIARPVAFRVVSGLLPGKWAVWLPAKPYYSLLFASAHIPVSVWKGQYEAAWAKPGFL